MDSTLDQQRALLGSIKKQLCSAIGSKDAEKAFAHFDLLYPGVLDVDNWGDPDPVCKRYLRGVATSDNIIYVCTKPDPLSCPEGGINDKWWKLEYREDEAEPVRASVCIHRLSSLSLVILSTNTTVFRWLTRRQ